MIVIRAEAGMTICRASGCAVDYGPTNAGLQMATHDVGSGPSFSFRSAERAPCTNHPTFAKIESRFSMTSFARIRLAWSSPPVPAA